MIETEDTWTRPRLDCPHPEYWHAPDGGATEVEVTNLIAALVGALQPEFVIETGTHHMHTAIAIGEQLVRNGHGELVTIECDVAKAVRAHNYFNLSEGQALPVTVHSGDSRIYKPPEGRSIDFVFFDSALEARVDEFYNYRPYFTDRTFVVFHDTGPHYPLANELKALHRDLDILFLPTPRGVAIGQPR